MTTIIVKATSSPGDLPSIIERNNATALIPNRNPVVMPTDIIESNRVRM